MTEATRIRFNRMMSGLFMASALAVAMLVGLWGRADGQGWFFPVLIGAMAGVLLTYAVFFLVMLGVAAWRRVSCRWPALEPAAGMCRPRRLGHPRDRSPRNPSESSDSL